MTCDYNMNKYDGIIDNQRREILRLKDVLKRQHHIIDYLENRLYCY